MSQFNSSNPDRSSDTFGDTVVKGAGFALGGAIVGAAVAFILAPIPGSAETGAKIGSKIGALFGGGCDCPSGGDVFIG